MRLDRIFEAGSDEHGALNAARRLVYSNARKVYVRQLVEEGRSLRFDGMISSLDESLVMWTDATVAHTTAASYRKKTLWSLLAELEELNRAVAAAGSARALVGMRGNTPVVHDKEGLDKVDKYGTRCTEP